MQILVRLVVVLSVVLGTVEDLSRDLGICGFRLTRSSSLTSF